MAGVPQGSQQLPGAEGQGRRTSAEARSPLVIWGVDPASKSIALFGHDGYLAQAHKIVVPKTDRGKEIRGLRSELEHWVGLDDNPIVFCEEPVLAGRRN